MANIQKRPNGKWRARYRDLDGKEHARHFERKLDAQRWLDEVTASMVTGQYVDPRAGRVTFEKYAEKWEGSLIASEAGMICFLNLTKMFKESDNDDLAA